MNQNTGNILPWPYTVGLVDDSDARSAANVNTGPFGGLTRTLNIDRRLAMMQAQNWGQELLAINSRYMQSMRWAPDLRKWVIAVIETSGTPHFESWVGDAQDTNGTNWTQIGNAVTNGYAVQSILQVPGYANRFVAAVYRTVGGVDLMKLDTSGSNTWTITRSYTNADQVRLLAMPGPVIVSVSGGTNAANSQIEWSDDRGDSWNTAGAPYGTTVPEFCCASQDALALIVPRTVQASPQYWTSTSGESLTLRAFPGSVVSAADRPGAVAFGVDPLDGNTYGYMAVNKGYSGGGPYYATLYRTLDGANWTALGSIPNAQNVSYVVSSLACVNGMIVAQISTDSQITSSRAVVSFVGGGLWHYVPADLSSNVSPGVPYVRATIVASPYRLMMYNSFFYRASMAQGLPIDFL